MRVLGKFMNVLALIGLHVHRVFVLLKILVSKFLGKKHPSLSLEQVE